MTLSVKQHFKASMGSLYKLQLCAFLMLISHSHIHLYHIEQVWSKMVLLWFINSFLIKSINFYITALLIHVLESMCRTFTYLYCHMSYYHFPNIHSMLNLLILSWLIIESMWNMQYFCFWYMVLDQSSLLKLTYFYFKYNGHG